MAPSALYSSLRKYIDHPENSHKNLNIVYGSIHGTLNDVRFPIMRGRQVLVAIASEFQQKIRMKPVRGVPQHLKRTQLEWMLTDWKSYHGHD